MARRANWKVDSTEVVADLRVVLGLGEHVAPWRRHTALRRLADAGFASAPPRNPSGGPESWCTRALLVGLSSLGVKEIAALLGVTTQTIHNWADPKRSPRPSVQHLARMVLILGEYSRQLARAADAIKQVVREDVRRQLQARPRHQ